MSATIDETRLNTNPKKFVVWLFLVASIMVFIALTSAVIVRKGAGNWHAFALPSLFIFNTLVILISSGTLYGSFYAAKNTEIAKARLGLIITFLLGIVFLVGQWQAWIFLNHHGVFFSGNPADSFIYVLTGVHAAHIIAGLCLLLHAIQGTSGKYTPSVYNYRIQIASIFWHFLDILWICLYVFLLLNQ